MPPKPAQRGGKPAPKPKEPVAPVASLKTFGVIPKASGATAPISFAAALGKKPAPTPAPAPAQKKKETPPPAPIEEVALPTEAAHPEPDHVEEAAVEEVPEPSTPTEQPEDAASDHLTPPSQRKFVENWYDEVPTPLRQPAVPKEDVVPLSLAEEEAPEVVVYADFHDVAVSFADQTEAVALPNSVKKLATFRVSGIPPKPPTPPAPEPEPEPVYEPEVVPEPPMVEEVVAPTEVVQNILPKVPEAPPTRAVAASPAVAPAFNVPAPTVALVHTAVQTDYVRIVDEPEQKPYVPPQSRPAPPPRNFPRPNSNQNMQTNMGMTAPKEDMSAMWGGAYGGNAYDTSYDTSYGMPTSAFGNGYGNSAFSNPNTRAPPQNRGAPQSNMPRMPPPFPPQQGPPRGGNMNMNVNLPPLPNQWSPQQYPGSYPPPPPNPNAGYGFPPPPRGGYPNPGYGRQGY